LEYERSAGTSTRRQTEERQSSGSELKIRESESSGRSGTSSNGIGTPLVSFLIGIAVGFVAPRIKKKE